MGVLYDVNEIVSEISEMLGINAEENPIQLKYSVLAAKELICNYCNIDDIPEGLHMTMLRMAADIYNNELSSASSEVSILESASSVKIGDVSVSSSGDDIQKSAFITGLLKNDGYRLQLNRYRKIVFK